MRTSSWGRIGAGIMVLCGSVACGPSAPPPPPPESSSGHEEPPPPPPPPPPASIEVVHASPDPGLGTLSIRLDDATTAIVSDLAAGSASAPLEIAAGTHALHVLGVASVETGEALEVLVTSVELASGTRPIVLVYGEPSAVPPLTLLVVDEDTRGSATRARIVHGLVGVAEVDVCVAGVPIADGLAPGAITPVTPVSEGAIAIAIHAANEVACHGHALGTAHVTLAAATSYLITLSAHSPRRGHLTGAIVACSEGTSTVCENAAIGAR